jgi:hypothetical protein
MHQIILENLFRFRGVSPKVHWSESPFYTLISSNTTLRCMFAQGRKDGWTNADHYYVTPSLRGGGQKGYIRR